MTMKWTDLIRLSFTNLWRRKTRTILTMIGTMIGTASIVVMVSLGIGINQGYIDSMAATGELTNITVNSQTYYGGGGMVSDIGTGNSVKAVKLDDALVRKLSQLDHVTVVSPQLDLYNLTLGTGKLQSYTVSHLETTANIPLEEMEKAGELSGYKAEIDAEQDVLSTSTIEVTIKNVPVGVVRKFKVKIGFAKSLE